MRAACTATSMSSSPAAYTEVISCSSLVGLLLAGQPGQASARLWLGTHAGLIVLNRSPAWDGTNRLLINKPTGWLYRRPFGAVSETGSAMLP